MSRRAEIVETARRLFRDEGFAAVSLNRLCREVRIAKKTFYLSFPDKDALVDAIVTEAFADYAAALRAGADDAPVDARLRARMAALFEASARHFSAALLADLKAHRPALWATMEQARAQLARALVDELRRGQAEGLFRSDVDPDTLRALVDLVVDRVLDPAVLAARGLEPPAVAELLFRLLFDGLSPNRTAPRP